MNVVDWWKRVDNNWDDIEDCIERFHPELRSNFEFKDLTITAEGAEAACEVIRQDIKEKNRGLGDVGDRAKFARDTRNISLLSTILSETWFGAPENRSIMAVPGFSLICDLLDDLPDGVEFDE